MSDDPVARLVELFEVYCPLLDSLLTATPDNVAGLVKKEKGLARRIWMTAGSAYGRIGRGKLQFLEPKPDEYAKILPWLISEQWLSEAHRLSVLCCCVRSYRLARMIEQAELGRPKGKGGAPQLDPSQEIERAKRLWRTGTGKTAAVRKVGAERGLSGKDLDAYVGRNRHKMK